jgi:hypothetical protein
MLMAMPRGLSILLLLAGGCCCGQKASVPATQPTMVVYQDRAAAALAFVAPAGDPVAPDILERAGRSPRAFLGYETLITEYFWLRTDDRLRFGRGNEDRFERRAVSTRVGVRQR